jgi:hypothetical protein
MVQSARDYTPSAVSQQFQRESSTPKTRGVNGATFLQQESENERMQEEAGALDSVREADEGEDESEEEEEVDQPLSNRSRIMASSSIARSGKYGLNARVGLRDSDDEEDDEPKKPPPPAMARRGSAGMVQTSTTYALIAEKSTPVWTPATAFSNPYQSSSTQHLLQAPSSGRIRAQSADSKLLDTKKPHEMSKEELQAALMEARNQANKAQEEAALLRHVMRNDNKADPRKGDILDTLVTGLVSYVGAAPPTSPVRSPAPSPNGLQVPPPVPAKKERRNSGMVDMFGSLVKMFSPRDDAVAPPAAPSSLDIMGALSALISSPAPSPEPKFVPLSKKVSFSSDVDMERTSLSFRNSWGAGDSVRSREDGGGTTRSTDREGFLATPATVAADSNLERGSLKRTSSGRGENLVQQNIFLAVSSALRIVFAEIGYRHEEAKLQETIRGYKSAFPNTNFEQNQFEDRRHRFSHIFLYCKIQTVLIATMLQRVPPQHAELLYNCNNVLCIGGGSGSAVFGVAQYLRKQKASRSVSLAVLKVRVIDPEESWRMTWERIYLENYLTCASFEPASRILNANAQNVADLKIDGVDLFTVAFVNFPVFGSSWDVTFSVMDKIVETAKSGTFFLFIGYDEVPETHNIEKWFNKTSLTCIHEYAGTAANFDCITDNIVIHGYQKYADQFGALDDAFPTVRIRAKMFRKLRDQPRSARRVELSDSESSESEGE